MESVRVAEVLTTMGVPKLSGTVKSAAGSFSRWVTRTGVGNAFERAIRHFMNDKMSILHGPSDVMLPAPGVGWTTAIGWGWRGAGH